MPLALLETAAHIARSGGNGRQQRDNADPADAAFPSIRNIRRISGGYNRTRYRDRIDRDRAKDIGTTPTR